MAICALCKNERTLVKSHLAPAEAYRRARDGSLKKPDPITVDEAGVHRSSLQVQMPFLCQECEEMLNTSGEKYALSISFIEPGDFPLQDMLAAELAMTGDSRHAIYAGKNIDGLDIDQLVHYGASMFWKAAAGKWPSPNRDPVHIDLGSYEDSLRQFVLGEREFPETMILLLNVSPVAAPELPIPIIQPRTRPRFQGRCHQHHCAVLGLGYELFVGGDIPEDVRRCCFVHSPDRVILVSFDQELADRAIIDPRRVIRKSPVLRAWTKQRKKQ